MTQTQLNTRILGIVAWVLSTAACAPRGGDAGCSNSCRYAFDRECDDGRPGSSTALCAPGTDCADCGGGTTSDAGSAPGCSSSPTDMMRYGITPPCAPSVGRTCTCTSDSDCPFGTCSTGSCIVTLEAPRRGSFTATRILQRDGALGCWATVDNTSDVTPTNGSRELCEAYCPTCCIRLATFPCLGCATPPGGSPPDCVCENWACPPSMDQCP